MFGNVNDMIFGITAKDNYSSEFEKLNRQVKSTESNFGRATSVIAGLGKTVVGLGAAYLTVNTAVAAGTKFIQATSKQQEAVAQLNATLKSTGGAVGLSSSQLQLYAANLQKLTTYGDEETIKMMSQLATFTKISGDNFYAASDAIVDMASKLGMDLKGAAIQVGKALNDPVKGVSALGEAGVQFTEDQKDMIEAMVDAGDVAGAQRVILKELEVQFEGSAAAARDTLGGALTALGNAWGDNFELMGDESSQLQGKIEELTDVVSDPVVSEAIRGIGSALLFTAGAAIKAAEAVARGVGAFSVMLGVGYEAQLRGNIDKIEDLQLRLRQMEANPTLKSAIGPIAYADSVEQMKQQISDLIDKNTRLYEEAHKAKVQADKAAESMSGLLGAGSGGSDGYGGEPSVVKDLRSVAKAEGEAAQARDRLNNLVETAVHDQMPWRKMREEALELEEALRAVGNQLDGSAVDAVKAQIDDLRRKAHEAVQEDLYKVTIYGDLQEAPTQKQLDDLKEKGLDVADAWEDRFIDVFSNVFTSANGDLDDFGKNILDVFGQMAAENIKGFLDGTVFGQAANDNGVQLNKQDISAAVQQGSFGGVTKGLSFLFQEFGGMSATGAASAADTTVGVASGIAQSYAIGASSGSPLIGGIGGALSGAASGFAIGAEIGSVGGVPGMIAGAVIGGLAGVLGGSGGPNRKDQLAEFRSQRSTELEEQRGQLSSFIDVLNNSSIGSVTQEVRDLMDASKQFERLLMDAKGDENDPELIGLQQDRNEALVRIYQDFIESTDSVLKNLQAGIGFDGAFQEANAAMEQASNGVQGFISDIKELNEIHGLTANNAEQIAQATPALKDYLVSLLTGAEGLSEMETAMQQIEGSAAGLTDALEKLGYSAEETSQIVLQAQTKRMSDLRSGFTDDLDVAINALSGFGYLNEFSVLSEQFAELNRDAGVLGVGFGRVTDFARLSALNIIKDADLSEQAIEDLLQKFPEFRGVLGSVEDIMGDVIAHTLDRVEAENQLRSAYQRQEQELTTLIDRLNQSRGSLQNFASSVLLNQATSPLSLSARLEEAQRQYQEAYNAAQSGDPEDVSALSEIRGSLLDIAREAYGSTSGYTDILNQLMRDNSSLITVVDRELSIAQMQLDADRDQVSQLININSNIISLQDAIDNYHAAISGGGSGGSSGGGSGSGSGSGGGSTGGGGSAVLSDAGYIDWLYQTYLDRAADAEGRSFWLSQLQSGLGRSELEQMFINSDEARRLTGSFQMGGLIGNGLYNKDSVIAHYAGGGAIGLAGGEYVTRAPSVNSETYPTLEAINRTGRAPSGNSDALLREVAALREELRALRGVSQAVGRATIETGAETNRLLARNAERVRLQGRKAS